MRNNNNDIITIVTYFVVLNLHNNVFVSFWKNREGSLSPCEESFCVINQLLWVGFVHVELLAFSAFCCSFCVLLVAYLLVQVNFL